MITGLHSFIAKSCSPVRVWERIPTAYWAANRDDIYFHRVLKIHVAAHYLLDTVEKSKLLWTGVKAEQVGKLHVLLQALLEEGQQRWLRRMMCKLHSSKQTAVKSNNSKGNENKWIMNKQIINNEHNKRTRGKKQIIKWLHTPQVGSSKQL